MKRYLIAFTVIILAVVAIFAIKKYKEKNSDGIGKVANKFRPPRLRIVYSKKLNNKDREKVTSSADVNRVLKEIWSNQIETREEFIVLLLDRSNNILGYHVLSSGGITGTVADLRLLFGVALQSLATSVIIAHNHPSGNLSPSQADIALTKKIKEAGEIMSITLLDHIIITKGGYLSFQDEGHM
jgi:DNA repair protein RadC